jgi:hypothetical protein
MRSILRPFPLLVVALGLLLTYGLIGFFLLPYLIRTYAIPAVAERIRHPVIVQEVSLNPFLLSLRLTGLEVRESDQTPILGFEELFVNLHGTTLFLRTIAFDEIRLIMPFVSARLDRQGQLNLLNLMPSSAEHGQDGKPPVSGTKSTTKTHVVIDDLLIDRGIVEYRDESKATPFFIDIVPIHIALRNFSTSEGGENAYAFTAEMGKGEGLAWEGSFSLDPLESDGRLHLTGLQARTLYQAVQDLFRFDVRQGELALSGSYRFDLKDGTSNLVLQNGKMALRTLVIGEQGSVDSLINVPSLDVDDVSFNLAKRAISIGKISSADARLAAWVDPDGMLNYQRLLGMPSESAPASSVSPAQAWSIGINEIALRRFGALFEDRSLARPSHLDVQNIDLFLKDVRVPLKGRIPMELSLNLNQTGEIAMHGQLSLDPMAADMELTVKQLPIRPFQPYLDRYLYADVRNGAITLAGALHYAEGHSSDPLLRFQGNVALDQFSMTDRTEFQDVVSWKSLAVNRLALQLQPTAVTMGEIVWQEPRAHVSIGSDGTLNLSQIVMPQPDHEAPESKRPGSGAQGPVVPVVIQTVKLVNAGGSFRDLSIEPMVKTGISELSGTIKGLSSKEVAKADVALAGRVGAGAPLKVTGQINPLTESAFTDLLIICDNLDLTMASPYAGKYAGYPIDNGKLFLDLKYKIAKHQLIGENKVLIDQLIFGQKTNSPDATSLPVPLAVALLKDRKGQIEVDLPVRGDLNDPDFKYGRVLLNALLNLLGKVATSPLSLLGSLVGGGGDDLQVLDYAPGQSRLSDTEAKKLAALEKILTERPGLYLDITGTADPQKDRPSLAEETFRARLFQMKHERQRAAAPEVEIAVSLEEEAKFIDQMYAEQTGAQPRAAGPEPTIAEKRARLVAMVPVQDSQFRQLATNRAVEVKSKLLASGTLADERLVLRDVVVSETSGESIPVRLTLAGR